MLNHVRSWLVCWLIQDPSWYSTNYRIYMGSSVMVWLPRWLLLYLCFFINWMVLLQILFQKVKWIATPLLCGKKYLTRAKYRLEKPSTYTSCHYIEFGQTLWLLLRNLSCSQDQDHVHYTYICCSYTRSMQQHVFHPPKNVLLLHWE